MEDLGVLDDLGDERQVLQAWLTWVETSLAQWAAVASVQAEADAPLSTPPLDPAQLCSLRRVILEELGKVYVRTLCPSNRRN